MRALWIVMGKELIDAFRDRRMVLMAFLVMPLAVPSLLAGMSAVGMRKQMQKLEATLELPAIGAEHAPNLMAWLGSHNIRIVAAPDDPEGEVRRQDHDVILRISPDYGTHWRAGEPARVELIYDSSRPVQTGASVSRLRGLLNAYSEEVGTLRLIAAASAPSASAQPALRSTPASSSKIASGTPVHSLHDISPWMTPQGAWGGCGFRFWPLLPAHSRNWIRVTVG